MATNSVEIENTPMWYEVLDVLTKCDKNTQAFWTVTFLLGDSGETYEPFELTRLTVERDYMGGFCDCVGLAAMIPYGKYAKKIYAYRNQLKAILTRYPLLEKSTSVDPDKPIGTQLFTAILKENNGAITQMQGDEVKDEFSLDLKGYTTVEFQLFSLAAERVRITTVGGIYRKQCLSDLCRYLITSNVSCYKIPEEQRVVGVDMLPADNVKKQEQIVIPHGLPLYDVPGFLQKKYGIYNAGLGSYVQGRHWFIYSLFDPQRFNDTRRTFTIYVLPKKKYQEIERTYRVRGTDISILATANIEFMGDTNATQVRSGSSTRFTSAANFMGEFGETKGNRFIVNRKKNNFEFKTSQAETELDYAPVQENRITSNAFVAYSELAMRKGGILNVIWENSRPNIIEPGMPCRVVYFDQAVAKEANGIILSVNHLVQKIGDFKVKKHSANTRLQIFAQLKNDAA